MLEVGSWKIRSPLAVSDLIQKFRHQIVQLPTSNFQLPTDITFLSSYSQDQTLA